MSLKKIFLGSRFRNSTQVDSVPCYSNKFSHLEANGSRYKREYKKALALLKDTQNVLAMERENAPSQSLIRQLREQMEEAEAAKLSALKGRHSLEGELSELRTQVYRKNSQGDTKKF
jgi:thiamine pyrophosphate-dependent acetolactate synthase large subunit-like protein